ncbi:MAG: shikimate kinase [Terracidiphilus sp.]
MTASSTSATSKGGLGTRVPARRIVLTGFMGSGKSTVGPLLAERLGWRFVDADDVIAAEAGCAIPEIFAREGEAAFRERERVTIARLAGEDALVLALGGGAIEDTATRESLVSSPETLLVHLEVELATTLERCRGTEHLRPVLADQANLAVRYQRRLPLYRAAHLSVAADTLTPEQVAEAIVDAARAPKKSRKED